jgi:hypothetical protein
VDNRRPYTAVLVNWQGHETVIVNVTASIERDTARHEIESEYTGATLIALVPGSHADASSSYALRYRTYDQSARIDPFETPIDRTTTE